MLIFRLFVLLLRQTNGLFQFLSHVLKEKLLDSRVMSVNT